VKIVGGIVANQGSWPSIAYVKWKFTGDFLLPTGVTVTVTSGASCGGTLISTRKILTAGIFDFRNIRKFPSNEMFNEKMKKIKPIAYRRP
jgi:hypothetical protein